VGPGGFFPEGFIIAKKPDLQAKPHGSWLRTQKLEVYAGAWLVVALALALALAL
jgi:hypothetical protein